LSDEELVTRGLWQYAHYYDPADPSDPARSIASTGSVGPA
jgi:hypothetical protein